MIARRAAALAAAAASLLTFVLPALPAGGQEPPAVNITLNDPVVDGSVSTVSGSAEMAGLLDWVTGVDITVSHRETSARCGDCWSGVGSNPRSVTFSFTTRPLEYNGPYEVSVRVTGQRLIDTLNSATVSDERTTRFRLEVRPAPPADVTAEANPDGTVNVSWTRNGEPDLVAYQVQRKGPSPDFLPVGPPVTQPPTGPTVRWTDTGTTAGGQFEYRVVAIRRDGDGNVTDRATSISETKSASVPVPPGASPGPGVPGPGASGAVIGPGGGRGPGSAVINSGTGSDLGSAFVEPDGTYSETLPFARSGDRAGRTRPGDAVVVLGHVTDKRALLLPVATGLLLCVAAFHLRLFNRRMLESATTEPLPAEPSS